MNSGDNMKRVILVNDDGINSPGLQALVPLFSNDFQLTIVAPPAQQSWIGKASSYHKSMSYEERTVNGVQIFILEGTPADCAMAGIYHLCDEKPDLIISGINVGANIGDSYILSSGTVGGALEGSLAGILSIAVGVEFSHETIKQMEFSPTEKDVECFSFAARFTKRMAKFLTENEVPQNMKLVNLNFHESAGETSQVSVTVPDRYNYGSFLEKKQGCFYHSGAEKNFSSVSPGTDMAAIRDGKISVTFLDLLSSLAVENGFITKFQDYFRQVE
jgi:5'-nucleotidase